MLPADSPFEASMRLSSVILASVACLISANLRADNWAHWRGPAGNGSSDTAHPPTEWSSTKNVKWKVEIPGRGSSSPVIWENQVFVTTAVPVKAQNSDGLPTLEFQLLSLDRTTGKVQWSQTAVVARPHQETHSTNGFASASACTDGQHVYAHFGSRGLYCYTMQGELKWKRDDLGKMNTRNSFGEGSSPTLEGNKILVPWDHEGPSALFALDKMTGKTLWKTDRDEPTCWSTPLVVTHGNKKQVIMNGQTCARSYDLESGKELWRCAGQTERPCASPVADKDLVYVTSGHRGSFMGAFRLDGTGNVQGTTLHGLLTATLRTLRHRFCRRDESISTKAKLASCRVLMRRPARHFTWPAASRGSIRCTRLPWRPAGMCI